MSKTLVLLFHRDMAKSKANTALARAARAVPTVEVIDMQAAYPTGAIDIATEVAREAQRLLAADRLVLQFPIQWYSTPALLKTWQDAVLTRMFYIFTKDEGDKLAGTPIMIAATAGNVPEAYGPDGANGFSMEQILTPLKATAHRCSLPWNDPYLLYRADKLESDELDAAASDYAAALRRFITAAHRERATA